MKARSIASRILLVFLATLMFALSGTLAWGVVNDYQARGLITQGVSVAGHDLSGMTEAQARRVIEDSVTNPMLSPVTITGDNRTWTFTPLSTVNVDVDAMIKQAYAPRRSATFVTRVQHELTDEPLPAEISIVYSVDPAPITAWIAQAAAQVNRQPVNATRKVVNHGLRITKSVPGAKVNQRVAFNLLSSALLPDSALATSSRVVTLPVAVLKPKVVESSFGQAIVVALVQCKIRLFQGAKLVKTYDCAPGQPEWPTPTGDFKIAYKVADAPWINPHDAWSASMPDIIPGGPDNPMGDRKIAINFPGVFFHGIPPGEFGSIGTHASHGCMRMFPAAVHDLYARVKVGTPVFIRE